MCHYFFFSCQGLSFNHKPGIQFYRIRSRYEVSDCFRIKLFSKKKKHKSHTSLAKELKFKLFSVVGIRNAIANPVAF